MTRADKLAVIEELKEKFASANYFYLADSSTLSVDKVNELRKLCFEKEIELRVVKNTLIQKALEQVEDKEYDPAIYGVLKGPTSVIFTEVGNAPAKVIKEFRKTNEKPVLKAAYVDSAVFVGDDQLDALASLKSKDELVGDVILLLQSPAKNVLSSLKGAGSKLSGILKTLSERESA